MEKLSSHMWTTEIDQENQTVIKRRRTAPPPDMRGKHQPINKLGEESVDKIRRHIESYHPQASHYQRENAPNRRYISSEVSARAMFENFDQKNPNICKASRYFNEMKRANVVIGTPKVDQCDVCRVEKEIQSAAFEEHRKMYTEARKAYQVDKDKTPEAGTAYFSVDLQKVLL